MIWGRFFVDWAHPHPHGRALPYVSLVSPRSPAVSTARMLCGIFMLASSAAGVVFRAALSTRTFGGRWIDSTYADYLFIYLFALVLGRFVLIVLPYHTYQGRARQCLPISLVVR